MTFDARTWPAGEPYPDEVAAAYDDSLRLQAQYEARKVYRRQCARCGDEVWIHKRCLCRTTYCSCASPCRTTGCDCAGFVERGALVQGAAR